MKIRELRNLNEDELAQKEKQFKKELFGINSKRNMGRVEKPAVIRQMKKDIARILTLLNERKRNGKKS